jgi:hypothetical protein
MTWLLWLPSGVDRIIELLKDVGKELIIGFTTFVLGLLVAWLSAWLRRHYAALRANRLWKYMLSDHVIVVLSGFVGPDDRQFEPSGTIGIGDARALSVLEVWFKSIAFSNYEIQYAHEISGDARRDNNLICVGGPDANPITKDVWHRRNFNWSLNRIFKTGDLSLTTNFDNHGNGDDGSVICFGSNPYSNGKWALLLFGKLSGFGSWAGTESVTTRPIRIKQSTTEGFVAVLSTNVAGDRPQNSRVFNFQELQG